MLENVWDKKLEEGPHSALYLLVVNQEKLGTNQKLYYTYFGLSMTQFQIECGGVVQGVTKLIMTSSTFFDLTN